MKQILTALPVILAILLGCVGLWIFVQCLRAFDFFASLWTRSRTPAQDSLMGPIEPASERR